MRHLALIGCLVLTGSIVHADPDETPHKRRHAKAHKHRKHAAVTDDEARESVARHYARVGSTELDEEPEPELVDEPSIHTHALERPKKWHVAIGPNVWASSVDAKVSLGSKTISAGVDFFSISKHARYGVPALVEATYGKFSAVADVMYGVVDIDGAKVVGPLMMTLGGTASSLQVDGFGGYRVAGDDESTIAVDARVGVRYQRTAIAGSLAVDGSPIAATSQADAGADALAGARVQVRPSRWFGLVGAADVGVFGSSATTWSASADANTHITSHVLLTLGYRTLTMDRATVQMVMHGPRAAIQVVF